MSAHIQYTTIASGATVSGALTFIQGVSAGIITGPVTVACSLDLRASADGVNYAVLQKAEGGALLFAVTSGDATAIGIDPRYQGFPYYKIGASAAAADVTSIALVAKV